MGLGCSGNMDVAGVVTLFGLTSGSLLVSGTIGELVGFENIMVLV
jgi:hypothetical protein